MVHHRRHWTSSALIFAYVFVLGCGLPGSGADSDTLGIDCVPDCVSVSIGPKCGFAQQCFCGVEYRAETEGPEATSYTETWRSPVCLPPCPSPTDCGYKGSVCDGNTCRLLDDVNANPPPAP